MDTVTIFLTQFVLSIVVYSLVAKWYAAPWLAGKTLQTALMLLILPHAFRHIGLGFMVPGLVGDPLPGLFAGGAAYGDFAAGLLAILALVALRSGWGWAIPLVWVFNVVGTADLLNALRQVEAVPNLGVMWFVPTFIVPLLLVTHTMIFARLVKAARPVDIEALCAPSRRNPAATPNC
jgi:hypothetical protein